MLISPEHKLIFFKPLKCAGSSIECTLYPQLTSNALCAGGKGDGENWEYFPINNEYVEGEYICFRFHQHVHPELFYKNIKNKALHESYFNVTVVRNPWDTIVSYYWYQISLQEKLYPPPDFELAWKIYDSDSQAEAQEKFYKALMTVTPIASMEEDKTVNQPPLLFAAYYNEKMVHEKIDIFIQFENLKEDFDKLCKTISMPRLELVHLKGKVRKLKRHYSWYYNDELKDIVAKAFPKTINKFNYEFEDETW